MDIQEPIDADFARSVLTGLAASPKRLESKYLYDARGAELFDAICELDEYYPTRTELALLRRHAAEMAGLVGAGAVLVELGSGASVKSRLLLDAMARPAAYVPVDISAPYLEAAEARLRQDYPGLPILPVVADFTRPFDLPAAVQDRPHLLFFPGSTIGNLDPEAATVFLAGLRRDHDAAALIVGTDLEKDEAILIPAYDDAQGVTAAFNLNILRRINRELGGDLNERGFRHEARYDPRQGRIEMHLVSDLDQEAHVMGRHFSFQAGESIHTENSYKYSVSRFTALAARAGWRLARSWCDERRLFAVHGLKPDGPTEERL